jgi:hypothetical protein
VRLALKNFRMRKFRLLSFGLLALGFSLACNACNSTYRDEKTEARLYPRADYAGPEEGLRSGPYPVAFYQFSSQVRARWGRVYDGGRGVQLYIVFTDPSTLVAGQSLAADDPRVKLFLFVHADPGYHRRATNADLRGAIQIIEWTPGETLIADVRLDFADPGATAGPVVAERIEFERR